MSKHMGDRRNTHLAMAVLNHQLLVWEKQVT
jgi:hypothetical protein